MLKGKIEMSRRKYITCDRCGRREEFRIVAMAGSIMQWDENVCGQTLCPKCAKEFDDWFDQFMRGWRNDGARTSTK